MTHRRDTVPAALVDGALVRAQMRTRLAAAAGGEPLRDAVDALLRPYPPEAGEPELRAGYEAQERAAPGIAAHLDEQSR